ncbi:ZPR1 zinc-finger domain-containing protein [Lipomyces japonicus]|uniref:ZPR1 zinc-finger domain-containing protein n=1 Tax=Lipomyces japonicus TaxID=56871 RepID=UPI0034D01DC0
MASLSAKNDSSNSSNTTAGGNEEFFRPVGETVQAIDDHTIQGTIPSSASEESQAIQEVESLCMNCHENGTTRLLLTRIPYFREIILMSFSCPHCGFRNSEIQQASEIQQKGSRYTFLVETKEDLNRQVVKSESCDCSFPVIALEIPHQRGQLTTVEGLLTEVIDDLEQAQPVRKYTEPEAYEKIEQFLASIKAMVSGEKFPFEVVVNDPSGNSWVEYSPGDNQHKWRKVDYFRTLEQNEALGLVDADANNDEQDAQVDDNDASNPPTISKDEVHTFHATCPSCLRKCDTHMKLVDIPHFKEVIIMSTVCDTCGYKSNEVKTGGEIPDKGSRITLKVDDPEDLARDILKSETAALRVPELNLDLSAGTLGGRFTTLEGLLREVYEQLDSRVFNESADSMEPERVERWRKFLQGLQDAIDGKIKFTVIIEDPLAASYLQNIYAPDPDPNMTVEEVDRTDEQNEDLGLNDISV